MDALHRFRLLSPHATGIDCQIHPGKYKGGRTSLRSPNLPNGLPDYELIEKNWGKPTLNHLAGPGPW